MADRLEGYIAELSYPSLFHPAITPMRIAAALARAGLRPPDLDRPFRLLDLGCGDGVGLAVMAASHPASAFEGIDGNADHVARGLAFPARPANHSLKRRTFGEAMGEGRADCDFVTAQGVLAWVTRPVREALFDLAAERLAPGGVFAVSYNAMPGWANALALQRALVAFSAGAEGGAVARFDAALARVEALGEAALRGVPADAVTWLREQRDRAPAGYFPHEWLNDGWAPLWSDEAKAMAAARGLAYAGQSGFERARPDFTLRKAQREALEAAPEAERDGLADLLLGASFRIDLYVKGKRPDPEARDRIWLAAAAAPDAALEWSGPAGALRFDNPATRWLLGALADGPRSLAALASEAPFGRGDLRNAADCLLVSKLALPAAPPSVDPAPARRLNEAIRAETEAGRPSIPALAGAHGPVEAPPQEIVEPALPERLRRLGVADF